MKNSHCDSLCVAISSPLKVKQSRGNVLPRFCFTLGGWGTVRLLAETVDVNIDLLQQLYLYVMKELLTNFKLVYGIDNFSN